MRELGLTLTWIMVAALCFKCDLGGIAKAGGDLATLRADRLLDLSAVLDHRGESRRWLQRSVTRQFVNHRGHTVESE